MTSPLHGRGLTSPSTVRETMERAFGSAGHPTQGDAFERWYETRIAALRAEGLLITERQEIDARRGRMLRAGDVCLYVGPQRLEENYIRPTGQRGWIAEARRLPAQPNDAPWQGWSYTFEPDEPDAPSLIVVSGTVSYWVLERVPDEAPQTIFKTSERR